MIVATNLYNFLFMLPNMKERKSVLELRTNPVYEMSLFIRIYTIL